MREIVDGNVIKMEELSDDYNSDTNDTGSAIPATSEPSYRIVRSKVTGRGKRPNPQMETQLNGLGDHTLVDSLREFKEWMEEDRLQREEQHQIWQQEWQATMASLTQSLHRNQASSTSTPPCGLLSGHHGNQASSTSTPPCGLLSGYHGDLAQSGYGCTSPKPQNTPGWTGAEEETEVSRCAVVPATTPPRSVSAPPAEISAASQEDSGRPGPSREIVRGAKRGRAPPPPPAARSVFQQGVLNVLNKNAGEDEQFLSSLVPTLKRLDNRKKSLVRSKFMQFLYDIEFSDH